MKSEELFERVSSQLAAQIAAGASGEQWAMPWRTFTTSPRSIDGRRYRGLNVMLLMGAAAEKGYDSPTWGTYKAWQGTKANAATDPAQDSVQAPRTPTGCQVRRGEKATTVVLWKKSTPKDQTPAEVAEAGKDRGRLFATTFSVFNAAQVDGYEEPPAPHLSPIEVDARAEAFLAATGATIAHGGGQAFYRPSSDSIQLPPRDAFHDGPAYYATSAHEHVHWSGAPHRLARTFGKRFGDTTPTPSRSSPPRSAPP
jgi:antirestriction protein ArdC